jgi:hypothetical protein
MLKSPDLAKIPILLDAIMVVCARFFHAALIRIQACHY